MRTRSALTRVMQALLVVVCTQGSNTEAQENTEARLSAAVSAAAPLTFELSQKTTEAQAAEALAYWTPERLANAQPMLPKVSEKAVAAEATSQGSGTPMSLPGKRPTVTAGADAAARLYDPAQVRIQSEDDGIELQAVGSLGAHYTSARVNQPGLETIYPNRTVGKLFFAGNTGGNFVCSASVLRQRIVLTAGHCVHKGSGGSAGFHRNFLFVPALRDGAAPLGTFTPRRVGTTSQWRASNGVVPNAADFGMLEMNDRAGVKIGAITGTLGFRTLSLLPNHTTKLGYPCNIDACQKMQQVTSQSFRATNPNNVEYGSNARGGSSGGPWVQNYGIQGKGGLTSNLNAIVGVASYGYVSTDIHLQGSSIPDSRAGGFIPLLNTMCAAKAGNCS
ncbi:MAG: hypothetical protein OEV27_09940 [Nitrospira sp.]|nr:hypothetical protein [Nitrospira sp.]MDH4344054.1 hypothetical protein [Nitrospira sp.]MDH5337947.1 hypothetical protein [Nitrospira sp.]